MSEKSKKIKIVILTGSELRHTYFRMAMANDARFEVITSYCEGADKSLRSLVEKNEDSSFLEKRHIEAREQSENDFFNQFTSETADNSSPVQIIKGEINNDSVVSDIIKCQPDILICYGSSLIKGRLLDNFEGKFLNVHLGLSPYYRGSGTNVFPVINGEMHMVGATFMYIDAGIDTGKIIHQIRADILLGDSPHSMGNRLIQKMTRTYADIVANFDKLTNENQPTSDGKLYYQKDFDAAACAKLYDSLSTNLIVEYLNHKESASYPYIVNNSGLLEN